MDPDATNDGNPAAFKSIPMAHLFLRTLVATTLAGLSIAASAATDQAFVLYNEAIDTSYAEPLLGSPYGDPLPIGQSFTAGLSGQLHQITVYVDSDNDLPVTLQVDLHAGDGVGGTLLGTKAFLVPEFELPASSSLGNDTLHFNFDSLDIEVEAGQQYTFDIRSISNPQSRLALTGLVYSSIDGYRGGEFITGRGRNPGADLYFATDVLPSPPDLYNRGRNLGGHGPVASPVPEPSSSVLMLLALAGWVGGRRSLKRRTEAP